ncbi:hypothetical protein D3C83_329890 [compost metagenome]
MLLRIVMRLHGKADLLQVTLALGPPRGLPRCLNRGQQQRDQDADDCDHHE